MKDRCIRAELLAQTPTTQTITNIQRLLIHLEGKGRKPRTIQAYEENLKALTLRADLNNPQEVELAINRYKRIDHKTHKFTNKTITNSYKSKLCDCYTTYCKFYKIEWEKPIYTPEPKSISPPTKETMQKLISASRNELSIKLDIIFQTGMRPCEIHELTPLDIHTDTETLTMRSHKGCNQRPPLKITTELIARLKQLITKKQLNQNDRLFEGNSDRFGEHYRRFRNKLAIKLQDETLKNVRLYDFRHAYATNQLRKTQNTEIVRQIMGHKKLDTTQKYLHLLGFNIGEWIVEMTNDRNRAKELVSADFKLEVTTPDGYMIFRKPK